MNPGPLAPHASALPNYATPRKLNQWGKFLILSLLKLCFNHRASKEINDTEMNEIGKSKNKNNSLTIFSM